MKWRTLLRRPHSTNQKVVQGKCPLHFVHFNGVVCPNTLFSNTFVLTNSLLFRANSTCKGSRTPRLVEHFLHFYFGGLLLEQALLGTLWPSHFRNPHSQYNRILWETSPSSPPEEARIVMWRSSLKARNPEKIKVTKK